MVGRVGRVGRSWSVSCVHRTKRGYCAHAAAAGRETSVYALANVLFSRTAIRAAVLFFTACTLDTASMLLLARVASRAATQCCASLASFWQETVLNLT